MRRIHLTIEYDGTNYAGWQRQSNALAVQQVIEEALSHLTGERVVLHGASRTDAGVHALGQSAHFDTESRIPGEKFSYAVNTMLPPDIRVSGSEDADPGFHARFSTVGKRYRYLFYDAHHAGALNRFTHAHSIYPLNDMLMQAEANALIGTHDFAAFAASGSVVQDTVRTIWRADVTRQGHDVMLIVEGSGFLYNMVRIIAGTLRDIGSGKLEPGALKRAIETGDRLDLGVTAPAHGLTLMEVFYRLPETCVIPVPPKRAYPAPDEEET
ncbi:MAG: tRNA pseudouridine(38-40) synthase TruA [Clostridia bacterium]|nr:tRNA pseudouridine(38-40) synthase TruA [Clostridia bacterium]